MEVGRHVTVGVRANSPNAFRATHLHHSGLRYREQRRINATISEDESNARAGD